MSETLTQKIQNDFDRIARLESVNWDHNSHYHNFLLKQLPFCCERVLEIGCGTGAFSRLLSERAERVVAVDLSPKMIEIAKQQSSRHPNIDFQVADILKWEFPIEQFDAIVSIATVHHLPLENLLPSLKVALKPGGKLVILDLLNHKGVQDILMDVIAIPLNWIFQLLRNRRVRPSLEAVSMERTRSYRQISNPFTSTASLYTFTIGSIDQAAPVLALFSSMGKIISSIELRCSVQSLLKKDAVGKETQLEPLRQQC